MISSTSMNSTGTNMPSVKSHIFNTSLILSSQSYFNTSTSISQELQDQHVPSLLSLLPNPHPNNLLSPLCSPSHEWFQSSPALLCPCSSDTSMRTYGLHTQGCCASPGRGENITILHSCSR